MMIERVLIVAVGLVLAGAAGRGAELAAGWDLEAVLTRVEEEGLAVMLRREGVERARAEVDRQRSGLRPSVDLEVGQTRSRTVQTGGTLVTSGTRNRFDAVARARWDLWDPAQTASQRVAQMGVEVAELDERAGLEAVRALAAELYFNHQRNLDRLQVRDADIERATSLLELAERQTEAGVATQIDVTRAEALVAEAEQARLQQETEVAATRLRLQRLLGLDMDEGFELRPVKAAESGARSAGEREREAREVRGDFLTVQRLLDQSQLELAAARFTRLPTVGLTASYGYATASAFDGNEGQVWSAGLLVSVPIFDGGETRALTRLARARMRERGLEEEELGRGIAAEVRLAMQDEKSRVAQVGVAQRTLRLAEDELELAKNRFENGVADNREIIEAQSRLAGAADNLVGAWHQLNLARLELARVSGDVRRVLGERED